MQPIWCTLSKAHSHASPRSQPFQVGRRYDLSEASLQVLHEALPPILDLHIKFFPYDAACHPQITYLRLTSLSSSRRSSTLRPVLSRRTSSGQGTCLQRSGYSSHQGVLCFYGVELSDFTDRRLIKQQTRPRDDIRLRAGCGTASSVTIKNWTRRPLQRAGGCIYNDMANPYGPSLQGPR